MHDEIEQDLYEILGVSRNATKSEIKAAYRKKARECHPDVAKDDPESERKFKELTFAYEILSDDVKRRDYDMWGLEGLKRHGGIEYAGFTTFQDLIDMFFSGPFGSPFRRTTTSSRVVIRGRDLEVPVSLTLKEVLSGVEREIEYERLVLCGECDGTGMMPGTHLNDCKECRGTGQITTRRDNFFGTFLTSRTCRICGGTGRVMTHPCSRCAGEGRVKKVENLKVHVPQGLEDGDHLRIRGKGDDGVNGGEPGDLYVEIRIEPDSRYIRDGETIYTEVEVDMVDAALGCEMNMDSLDGPIKLAVPPGTQPGDIIRVKGKGLPRRGGHKRGDMIVAVKVLVPKKISAEERKILEKLRGLRSENVQR